MKGITIYLDLISQARNRLTDEQLGRLFRATLDAAETETIPTFDDPYDDLLFDGFRACLQKGFECVAKKRKGINNRWDKEKVKNPKLVGEIEPDITPEIINQTPKTDSDESADISKIQEFFTENGQYLENNYSCINASTVNGNPKLLNFMGQYGFTADTLDKVYQEMKNNNK